MENEWKFKIKSLLKLFVVVLLLRLEKKIEMDYLHYSYVPKQQKKKNWFEAKAILYLNYGVQNEIRKDQDPIQSQGFLWMFVVWSSF